MTWFCRGEPTQLFLSDKLLDEFQNYTTDNITDILSESRKYGLSLVLAHQFLAQLPATLLAAVLNNAGTIASFRVGYHDASLLVREFFPPGYLARAHWDLKFLRFGRYRLPIPLKEYDPLNHEELTALLTELPNREFIVKHRGPYPPLKLRTLDMPQPKVSESIYQAREQLVSKSGARFGRLKSEARKESDATRGEPKSSNPSFDGNSYFEEI